MTMPMLAQRRLILIIAAAGLVAMLLIGSFVVDGLWQFGLVAAALAALWLLGWQRGWLTPVDLGFVGMIGLAAFGAIESAGRPTGTITALLMLTATVSALTAWDVMRFDLRLRACAPKMPAPDAQPETRLDGRHLRRIAAVAGVGFVAGALAIVLRTQLSFTTVALVLLLALLLFALSLRELRKDA